MSSNSILTEVVTCFKRQRKKRDKSLKEHSGADVTADVKRKLKGYIRGQVSQQSNNRKLRQRRSTQRVVVFLWIVYSNIRTRFSDLNSWILMKINLHARGTTSIILLPFTSKLKSIRCQSNTDRVLRCGPPLQGPSSNTRYYWAAIEYAVLPLLTWVVEI